ncbi:hypothetical protein [Solibacillus sp. FSL H8-0538]|uniref:hypothetical protein n=1 Tax=Solibacillus sp. FSL H8-0538 TaxID=2921400 RepID=UPI0030F9CA08
MYNRPVLFDKSPTIVEEFTIESNRRKIAVLFDRSGKEQAGAIQVHPECTSIATYEVRDIEQEDVIRQFIVKQTMGTQFYIAASWDIAVKLFDLCTLEGLSESEIQTYVTSGKKRSMYCMKCYNTSEIPFTSPVQCCCGAHLEVGPYYSKIRKGYIGYPFVPVEQQQKVGGLVI